MFHFKSSARYVEHDVTSEMAVTRLYLGKSIADLNGLTEVKVDKTTSPKLYES